MRLLKRSLILAAVISFLFIMRVLKRSLFVAAILSFIFPIMLSAGTVNITTSKDRVIKERKAKKKREHAVIRARAKAPRGKKNDSKYDVDAANDAVEDTSNLQDYITLDNLRKKKPAVVFPHRQHYYNYSISCNECHHTNKKRSPCLICHKPKVDNKGARKALYNEKGTKNIFHDLCRDCHRDDTGPTECAECHEK